MEKVDVDRQARVFGFTVGDEVIIWTAATSTDGLSGIIQSIRGNYIILEFGSVVIHIPIAVICGIGRAP